MTEVIELKPCPFCSGDAAMGSGPNYHFVNCIDCMASTNLILADSHMPTEAEAITAWNTRTLTPAQAAGPVNDIPRDIVEQVLRMGRAEWGATEELTSEGHLAHLEKSLRLTREHFDYADIPVKMHGLYLDGTETVLCHTGTSPNSSINAQALTGAWNWLYDQCAAITQAEGPQA